MRCPKCNSNKTSYENVKLSDGNNIFALTCGGCGTPYQVFDYPIELVLLDIKNAIQSLNSTMIDIGNVLKAANGY